ncbi:hypothetical protein [Deinococcus aquatilis]|uniref:hypothetical protein n=1 Tax=Deinococcus aquatilis TaxID=519440 RepID=UPI0012FBFB56|nr:hypothetical protein [Deinococcus aquatilis]
MLPAWAQATRLAQPQLELRQHGPRDGVRVRRNALDLQELLERLQAVLVVGDRGGTPPHGREVADVRSVER